MSAGSGSPKHLFWGPKIVKADGVYFYCERHKQDCKFRELTREEALKLYEIVKRFSLGV